MTLSREARNLQARTYVENWLAEAKLRQPASYHKAYVEENRLLEQLIPIRVVGFRGVVLTAMVGKALNPAFDPTTDFYACHPRSIFEKGIYYALVENGVPCGKSDPLNVAKNAQSLDANWARGRSPEAAALAAVAYIDLLHRHWSDETYRETLIALFFDHLWKFAQFCQSRNTPLASFSGIAPVVLASRLADFVAAHPEGGATPQLVVGTLIRVLRLGDANFSGVNGVDESVFGTNTTSKKPADVWENLADGSIGMLYEITAKPIDRKRLDDCIETLHRQDIQNRIVTFICRLPDDVRTLTLLEGALLHAGMAVQFLDMRSFILTTFCLLDAVKQAAVITFVDDYVKATNRKTTTKDGWANAFGVGE